MKRVFLCLAVLAYTGILGACAPPGQSPNDLQFERARAACAQVVPKSSDLTEDCASRLQAALSETNAN